MNNAAIEKFCIWARGELIAAVSQRAAMYGIRPDTPVDVDAIEGKVLSASEKVARSFLMKRLRDDGGDEKALAAVVEQGAYTWFNRFAALRYMEVNGRLPSRVRVFSASDGEFAPQILSEALNVNIMGLDRARLLELLAAGDDEATFRYLLLAQCHELADCLPDMFGGEDAWELLLPEGLLRNGGVIQRLVDDIDEDDWREGVQIVGWMYQYYNAERKREVFDGYRVGKKAERKDIPPATTVYTPDWLVNFMVENSLGRLWMLEHPESDVADNMRFYIRPEGEIESHATVGSPECISFCDPCCGSGHILIKAFDLLSQMYAEAGYVPREAVRLIIENNLVGIEIDPRAAALASFALSMKACEGDSRFLTRDVTPHIHCLSRITFDETELALVPSVAARLKLVDAMAHLDECGSLFVSESGDIAAIDADLTALEGSLDLFADAVRGKLSAMKDVCALLSRQFDIVVTNPPYMGSSNMNKWLGDFTKEYYPDAKRDLCTCFISRCVKMISSGGYTGLTTSNSWMFISSFEKLREVILTEHTITSLVQMSVHGFKGIAAQVCAFVIAESYSEASLGGYVRLDSFDHHTLQEPKTLEAIANPDCGWFYRRAAEDFKAIPGSPIAYWASDAMRKTFSNEVSLEDVMQFKTGMVTGNNDRFLRLWWEPAFFGSCLDAKDNIEAKTSGKKWFPYNKGGEFRRWYGNNDYLINYANEGFDIFSAAKKEKRAVTNMLPELRFKTTITWSLISSNIPAFRIKEHGFLYDKAGLSFFPPEEEAVYSLGLCNSSLAIKILQILAPTMNFQLGDIWRIPYKRNQTYKNGVIKDVLKCIELSKKDWDSFETSWDFKHHPMV